MRKVYSTDLIDLIKSLSSGEKRYIKKFALRSSTKSDRLYLNLFNDIDRQKVYSKNAILNNVKYARHLSQLKKYLHAAICKGLDAYHAESSPRLQLIKMINMIEIFYDKGLEAQCWKLLANAKKIARTHEIYPYLIELLQWERRMSSPIDRELEKESREIYSEEQEYLQHLNTTNDYWRLRWKLTNFANRNYSIRTNTDIEKFNKLTDNPLFKSNKTPVAWRAKLYFHELKGTFFDITRDFYQSYLHRRACLNLYENFPEKKLQESQSYLITLNNYLVILILLKKYREIEKCIALFRSIRKSQLSNKNIRYGILLLFANILDFYLSRGEFEKGEKLIKEIDLYLRQYEGKISKIIELALSINSAIIYFGAGNFSSTLHCLNKIIMNDSFNSRNDITCFARILNLITHFELGNIDILEYAVISTYRFLYKKEGLHQFEIAIINFIRQKLPHVVNNESLIDAFIELKNELEVIIRDPLEQKALESFDFISWLESKIQNRPFAEVFREKVMNY